MQTKRIKKKTTLKHLELSIILAHLHYENNDCSSVVIVSLSPYITCRKIIRDN